MTSNGAGGASLDTTRIVQLCADAGWLCTVSQSGGLLVEIDAGHARYQSRLEVSDLDGLRATVDLCELTGHSPASRSATEALLEALGSTVRAVHGAIVPRADSEWAVVSAAPSDSLAPEVIDLALSALCVACRMAGREVQALQHEAIASEYLAWRPLPPPDVPEEVAVSTLTMEENPCLQQL